MTSRIIIHMISIRSFWLNDAMLPLVGRVGLAFATGRGGRRQREAARAALVEGETQAGAAVVSTAVPGITSRLVASLIADWGWGKLSAAEVQRLGHNAWQDQKALLERVGASSGEIDQGLVAIAKLGNWGQYPANMHRELVSWLGEPTPPKPMDIEIPVRIGKPGRLASTSNVETGILLPHVEFANLFLKKRSVFNKFMLGLSDMSDDTESVAKEFWGAALEREDPRLEDHPMRGRRRWKRFAIPIALHGDGVACIAVGKSGQQTMDTVSWSSVLAAGSTMRPQLLFALE